MSTPKREDGGDDRANQDGTVTVELALVLPVVVLLLVSIVAVLGLASRQAHLEEIARQAARLASVGMDQTQVETALNLSGAGLTMRTDPPLVHVEVAQSVPVMGLFDFSIGLSSHAAAFSESHIGLVP